jgi:hypothetical protein
VAAAAGGGLVTVDLDATIVIAHSEKEQAAPTWKKTLNSIMERRIGSCRRELLDRTLIWNQRRLRTVLREHENFYNTHRPHRTPNKAAPLHPLPEGVTDLDHFRVLNIA